MVITKKKERASEVKQNKVTKNDVRSVNHIGKRYLDRTKNII